MNTQHANVRLQQRGVPPLVLDLLLQFGCHEPAGNGTRKVFFDKQGRHKVCAYAGALAPLLNDHLDFYAVVTSDDQVITVGHRLERIRRH